MNYYNFFSIELMLFRSENTIVTQRSVKTSLMMLISVCLGSVTGILKLSIMVMVTTERASERAKEKLQLARSAEKLKKKGIKIRKVVCQEQIYCTASTDINHTPTYIRDLTKLDNETELDVEYI